MPKIHSHLTVRAILPLSSGLRALGYDPGEILKPAGLDPKRMDNPDERIPSGMGAAIWDRAMEMTADENIGLRLAQHADLGSFDVHFYAMISSSTLREAFERICRYERLLHETNIVELEPHANRTTLRHRLPGGRPATRQSAEFIIAAWVRGGRVATGADWAPLEVHFAHPKPTDIRAHADLFHCPVFFSTGENALVLSASLLNTPCIKPDPALLAVLDRYATDRIKLSPRSASLADQVRARLAQSIAKGVPTGEDLASSLKMSVRTMNRMLALEGTSFRKLLEQLRHELSVQYLRDQRISISEVAFLVGFSELSAFHRAFKRWTGLTPAQFRSNKPS